MSCKNIRLILLVFSLIIPMSAFPDKYWEQRVSLFDHLPVTENDIIFLGNSITDGGNFEELFKREDVKNRGIRSDIMPGVQKRLEQVVKGQTKKIFCLSESTMCRTVTASTSLRKDMSRLSTK